MTRRRTRAANGTDDGSPGPTTTTAPATTLPPDARERARRDLWRDAWGRAAVRSAQTLLVLALVVVVVWAGVQLQLVVVPLLITILLAAAASPLVGLLSRHLPRMLAVWITLLGAFAVLGGLGYLVGSAVRDQWSDLADGASAGLDELQGFLVDGPIPIEQEQIDSARESLVEFASGSQAQAGAITGATLVVEVLAGLFLGLVLLFFLLKDGERIWAFARSFLPPAHGHRYDVAAVRRSRSSVATCGAPRSSRSSTRSSSVSPWRCWASRSHCPWRWSCSSVRSSRWSGRRSPVRSPRSSRW